MQHATSQQAEMYPPPSVMLTRQEAAQFLGLTERCLDNYAKHPTKGPKYRKWGNRTWYLISDLAEFKAKMKSTDFVPYRPGRVYQGPRPSPVLVMEDKSADQIGEDIASDAKAAGQALLADLKPEFTSVAAS